MNKNPLFSIIVVSYNYGRFIESTILSILNQSLKDYELIIIDGGSQDETVNILEKYNNQINYWISEKDNGQSDAFNKGFRRANGKYLFWVNADDLLLEDALFKLNTFIIKKKYPDWIAGNTIYFSDDNTIVKCVNGPKWNDYLLDNAPIYVYGPTTIFKKDMLNEVGYLDEKLFYMMDTDLWLRFKEKGYKFKRINEYLWGFRFHVESKTAHTFFGKADLKIIKEREYMLAKNNFVYKSSKIRLQKIYKLLSGLYLKSWLDTQRLKGQKIS